MNVNQVAFCTVTILGGATIASSIAAATAVSTVATVAYAILAAVGSAFSIAATTGWFASTEEDTPETYFSKVKDHLQLVLPGMTQFIAQSIFASVIEGISRGISNALNDKISGRHSA